MVGRGSELGFDSELGRDSELGFGSQLGFDSDLRPWRPWFTRAQRPFRPQCVPPVVSGFRLPTDRPLEVEIGCGVGRHAMERARRYPQRTLVAIEHTRSRFASFERRLALAPPLPNLYPVHANAVSWVTHALAAATVSRFWLLYPNPYPRGRDRGKRWYAMPFVAQLLRALAPGGYLHLATNDHVYAREAQLFFTECWGLRLVAGRTLEAVSPGSIPPGRSHFEAKYLARGECCYDLTFAKGFIPLEKASTAYQ